MGGRHQEAATPIRQWFLAASDHCSVPDRTSDSAYRLWTTDYGLRLRTKLGLIDYGLKTTDYRLRTKDYGLQTTD